MGIKTGTAGDNVLSFKIPYRPVAERVVKSLGYQCPDHVLTAQIKTLLDMRKSRIISTGELEEMCSDLVDSSVSSGIDKDYMDELRSLLQEHHSETNPIDLETNGIEDELKSIYCLMGKYNQ